MVKYQSLLKAQERLKDIYKEFFWLGVQLLGGGYVIVPLIQQSIIDKRNWITNEELTNFSDFSISSSKDLFLSFTILYAILKFVFASLQSLLKMVKVLTTI